MEGTVNPHPPDQQGFESNRNLETRKFIMTPGPQQPPMGIRAAVPWGYPGAMNHGITGPFGWVPAMHGGVRPMDLQVMELDGPLPDHGAPHLPACAFH